ncbi:hypothetical protein BO94DRAFT_507390 [Aspergillus sclerotioniger CBS 115572]|uniref:Protein kinase domain-containing protein n=1 Tax=Aspergillus sclerotioniger CBS 115572 TaxID=1450535 RepID=A0A317XC82_9EURO|nr:hypothetical protein BO94DRAFT_507390 [Aspergillus sclerotioniger CBS 115572]PWY95945.1 hypothetical protein BO94DRAFT_507390 [Aspergillus sclerotioniger CBS 115572]
MRQAAERMKQAEERMRQEWKRGQRSTFTELLCFCHNLLSRPLRIESPSHSTTEPIPLSIGKYCPVRLEPWTDCAAQLQEIYNSVCSYLEPTDGDGARLFVPRVVLEEDARRVHLYPMDGERALRYYERFAVEGHVSDIVAELCKIKAAQDQFGLGNGIRFENHTNTLDDTNRIEEANRRQPSTIEHPTPDQFCIYRNDEGTDTLLTSVEYIPGHKLPDETIRLGLRPMYVWRDMVYSNKIPREGEEKLKYDAERLVCSALVQEYHVMIQEGLEYSYVANGTARVLLRVPSDDPSTLYYFFCDPNRELEGDIAQSLQEPKTSIARVLCMCLMAFGSTVRGQEWRQAAQSGLPLWTSNFDTGSEIPQDVLQQSGSQSDSSSKQRVAHERKTKDNRGSQPGGHDALFCTQRCLLGLQTGGNLDDSCPNVKLHRQNQTEVKHPLTSENLVRFLKAQLDENIDRCIPLGGCGAYGAPFKLTCVTYGYTVVGKGTTSGLWKQVSREAKIYQILQKAQGSAVPVFLGSIDLLKTYFLHGAGAIRHMLVMGWGGETTAKMEPTSSLDQEIRRSSAEIEALGIRHEDLRRDNILWNEELGRALIIDFHRSTFINQQLTSHRPQKAKRRLSSEETRDGKRLHMS